MKIEFEPIGYVRCSLKDTVSAPKFHTISQAEGVIEIRPDLADGLYRIEERTHLIVLFYFDRAGGSYELQQVPRSGGGKKGVFSICSPHRPNAIGLDVVELLKVDGNRLHVKNIDMLDGTPVLDIKPYKPLEAQQGSGPENPCF
jgi:tRNA-Thr(GGU) m(6)t(6)A37 methyltransferase TsaA